MTEKQKRGFALMSADARKTIARRGGIMAHLKGAAHTWTAEEARIAGKKGGSASRGRGRNQRASQVVD